MSRYGKGINFMKKICLTICRQILRLQIHKKFDIIDYFKVVMYIYKFFGILPQ